MRSLASQLSKAEENQRQQLASELHDNLGQTLTVGKMKLDLLPIHKLPGDAADDIQELKKVINNAITYTRELMSDLKPPPSISDDMRASIGWVAEKAEKRGLNVTRNDRWFRKPFFKV